jgi:prepilin-type N-terminal cleavage/methylation domain-containing protein
VTTLRSRRRPTAQGFTLLEVTIAMAVFTVGMLALAGMLIHALQGGSRGRHTTQATSIGEVYMERLQQRSWTQLAPTAGWTAPMQEVNTIQAAHGDQEEATYLVDWQIEDLVPGWTREISVRVTWDEKGRPGRSVVFGSIRFNREAL